MWQDFLFTAGNRVFAAALYPTLRARVVVPVKTSLPTAAVLWSYALAFLTLDLMLSAVFTACTATMWTLILVLNRPGWVDG